MKKLLFRHVTSVLLLNAVICFIWLLFLCNFFSYSIKKTAYNVVSASSQILTEIVSKDFVKEKFKNFFLSLEHNKEIFDFSIYAKGIQIVPDSKKRGLLMSIFKLSYPIKKDGYTMGYIELWPSNELLLSVITKTGTIFVFVVSLFCMFFISAMLFYVYIKKYIFLPMSCINNMVKNILGDRKFDSQIPDIPLWNSVFENIKLLSDGVIDLQSSIKLLFSATNVNASDVEFLNSVHTIFDILQSKIDKTSECMLFMNSESGDLKLIAKNSFNNDSANTIQNGADSSIWNCFCDCREIIIENMEELSEYDSEIFREEHIAKVVNIPLFGGIGGVDSIGVLTVAFQDEKYFLPSVLEVLRIIAKYLSVFMINMEEYNKLKEAKRTSDFQTKQISDELINTNAMLIQEIRRIKTVSDISSYASAKFDMENIIGYVIDKIVDILDVETAGVYIYSASKNLLYSVPGSFGINKVVEFKKEEQTVSNEVFNTKESVILKNQKDFQKYPASKSFENYIHLNSMLVSPVKGEDGIVAVVAAVNKIRSSFSDMDKKTLEQIAIVISSIIEKIKLYNKLKDSFNNRNANQ